MPLMILKAIHGMMKGMREQPHSREETVTVGPHHGLMKTT